MLNKKTKFTPLERKLSMKPEVKKSITVGNLRPPTRDTFLTGFASLVGFLSGLFGAIGASGWCCTITGAAVFSFLGLASISGYLVYYNKWLLAFSIIFLSLAILYYVNYKKNKSCRINNHVKKN